MRLQKIANNLLINIFFVQSSKNLLIFFKSLYNPEQGMWHILGLILLVIVHYNVSQLRYWSNSHEYDHDSCAFR